MNLKSCFDELEKLGAVSDDQASTALDRLDTLERQKTTAEQAARYGALGGVAGAALGGVRNAISGSKGNWRGTVGNAVSGAVSAGALPIIQKHFDRKAEEGTLKTYLKENEDAKEAAANPINMKNFMAGAAKGQASAALGAAAPLAQRAAPQTGAILGKALGMPAGGPANQAMGIGKPTTTPMGAQPKPPAAALASPTPPAPKPGTPPVPGSAPSGVRSVGTLPNAVSAGITAFQNGLSALKPPPMEGVPQTPSLKVGSALVKIANGDMLQHFIDKKRGDGVDRGKLKEKDSETDFISYGPGDFKKAKLSSVTEHKLHGHTTHQGLGIAIENRKGSVRSGKDKDGTPWRTEMKHPYGYIKGSKGADGEEVDCYIGPVEDAPLAHVVHQNKDDGKTYDEDKVMLGFGSKAEARKAYLDHYDDPKFLGPMKSVPVERLKELVESGKKLMKISFALPGAKKFSKPNAVGMSGPGVGHIAKPKGPGFGHVGQEPGTDKGGM